MRHLLVLLLIKFYVFDLNNCTGGTVKNGDHKLPTVGISVLVRNKAHTLPYFLTSLYNLEYPKDRLYLWFYSDFNEDNSIEIIEKWVEKHSLEYKRLYVITNSSSGSLHNDEAKCVQWTPQHFTHVINLREKALEFARQMWADYIFMIDADVFLTNPLTLRNLLLKEMDIVAPMLISDGLYSNFWCGMTEKFYYKRTDDYKPIQSREKVGCFSVPMVHTAVLINMKTLASDLLTYDPKKIPGYNGPQDDIIAFAVNAKENGMELMICNEELYGFILIPLEENDELKMDYEQLLNLKLLAISRGRPLPLESYMEADMQYPKPWKFGCNEIYMINLERRTERRKLMEMSFKELGMDVTHFSAVDGKRLDMKNLKERSITLMPNYEDPYHKRPMKAGEVGCFLSHYYIWETIVEEQIPITLILEDDIQFVPYFRNRFLQLLREIEELDWDLVYIGRKILMDDKEEFVTAHTTKPLYSYWTLGYLISERGARKLLDTKAVGQHAPGRRVSTHHV
ncbi:unnamed protein product [Arctia plantaginis]|uniref:Glycosyl transferase family 25 domain-containing protein n=1 Tax=Arctia plantaginis TaxID=874455 RepID=A0A8S0Z0Y6_ARCPL|nr:unnamed protein product [Arctia plantaginis]